MRNGPIVVGTDGSDAANATVHQGAALARASGSTLHIVSAYRELPARARRDAVFENLRFDAAHDAGQIAKAIAEDAAHEVRHGGIEIRLHTVPGDPVSALCNVAARVDASLIVVGNRGVRSPFRRLRPPIFEQLVRSAPCEVRVLDTEPLRRAASS